MLALLEEYLSLQSSNDKGYVSKLRKHIAESIKIFDGMGITEPVTADYEQLRVIIAAKPGRKKGTLMSEGATTNWVNATKNFYAWKVSRDQTINEPVEVQTSEAEVSDAEDVMDHDSVEQSIDNEQQVKRGRKPKPDDERRNVKISIYLTGKVYESMKALAALSMQDMSDIFFTLASDFVERNAEKLNAAQDFLANLGAIK